MRYDLYIRHGKFFNDDPQKRCYNGAYAKFHYEWSEWKKWFMSYDTLEQAEIAKRLFSREDQQFKIVEVKL